MEGGGGGMEETLEYFKNAIYLLIWKLQKKIPTNE